MTRQGPRQVGAIPRNKKLQDALVLLHGFLPSTLRHIGQISGRSDKAWQDEVNVPFRAASRIAR